MERQLNGTATEDLTWCYWCDRSRNECACAQDPNGIPEGHWSLEGAAEDEAADELYREIENADSWAPSRFINS